MKDIISSVMSNAESFRWLFFLVLMWCFYRYMNDGENPMKWWHFLSTKGADGAYYSDINKLGQVTGIAIGSFAVIQTSAHAKNDFIGFAAVLTTYFLFVGGVAAYAANLRSKGARVETVVTTEPAPATPVPVKTTVTKTEPILPAGTVNIDATGPVTVNGHQEPTK